MKTAGESERPQIPYGVVPIIPQFGVLVRMLLYLSEPSIILDFPSYRNWARRYWPATLMATTPQRSATVALFSAHGLEFGLPFSQHGRPHT